MSSRTCDKYPLLCSHPKMEVVLGVVIISRGNFRTFPVDGLLTGEIQGGFGKREGGLGEWRGLKTSSDKTRSGVFTPPQGRQVDRMPLVSGLSPG